MLRRQKSDFHCEFFIAHDSTVILCMFPLLSFELSNCLFCKRLVPRSSIPTYFITVVAVVVVLLYYLSTYICLPFECYRLSQFNFHRSYLHPFVCLCVYWCVGVTFSISISSTILFISLKCFHLFLSVCVHNFSIKGTSHKYQVNLSCHSI